MAAVNGVQSEPDNRKRVVVVGLGMVGIAFIEKLLKLDAKRREYDVVVIGEEPHLAYNRVGLTSYFQHREVERLYMNPEEWVRDCRLNEGLLFTISSTNRFQTDPLVTTRIRLSQRSIRRIKQ